MSSHKTYALLRYVPTYWDVPAPAIPLLLIAGAVLVATVGAYGILIAAALTLAVRLAYMWNTDAPGILRAMLASLAYLGRHRRLRP
jgi:hypothetical protein